MRTLIAMLAVGLLVLSSESALAQGGVMAIRKDHEIRIGALEENVAQQGVLNSRFLAALGNQESGASLWSQLGNV